MRGLSQTIIDELQSDSVKTCHLVELKLPTAQYLTDNGFNVDYDSNTYQANGYLLDIDALKESKDLRVNSIDIELTAVNQTFVSLFLNNDWINREVVIRRAVLGDDGSLTGQFIIFNGQITEFQVTEQDDTAEMTLSVASHWADFERTNGRLTNNNSQQYHFSGDLGFQYAANSIRDIKWGKA